MVCCLENKILGSAKKKSKHYFHFLSQRLDREYFKDVIFVIVEVIGDEKGGAGADCGCNYQDLEENVQGIVR